MIQKLVVQNLQSHTDSELEFHPGINVLVGESDTGKSALLRGIEWLNTGRPIGDWMVSHGTSQTYVGVDVDGKRVSRHKGKINRYSIGEKDFGAFRTEVPLDIIRALGMSDLNFSSQHSPPFLISLPSTQASRYLNEIVKLDKIDSAVDWVSRKKKATEDEHKALVLARDNARATIASTEWLTEALPQDKELQTVMNTLESIESDAGAIRYAVATLQELDVKRRRLVGVLASLEPLVDELSTVSAKLEDVSEEYNAVHEATHAITVLSREIERKKSDIEALPPGEVCITSGRPL